MDKEKEHMICPKELKERARKQTEIAKRNNLIKPHTEAFAKYPVEKEVHKGKKDYYFN